MPVDEKAGGRELQKNDFTSELIQLNLDDKLIRLMICFLYFCLDICHIIINRLLGNNSLIHSGLICT